MTQTIPFSAFTAKALALLAFSTVFTVTTARAEMLPLLVGSASETAAADDKTNPIPPKDEPYPRPPGTPIPKAKPIKTIDMTMRIIGSEMGYRITLTGCTRARQYGKQVTFSKVKTNTNCKAVILGLATIFKPAPLIRCWFSDGNSVLRCHPKAEKERFNDIY